MCHYIEHLYACKVAATKPFKVAVCHKRERGKHLEYMKSVMLKDICHNCDPLLRWTVPSQVGPPKGATRRQKFKQLQREMEEKIEELKVLKMEVEGDAKWTSGVQPEEGEELPFSVRRRRRRRGAMAEINNEERGVERAGVAADAFIWYIEHRDFNNLAGFRNLSPFRMASLRPRRRRRERSEEPMSPRSLPKR